MGIVIRQSIKASVVNYIGAFIGFLTMMFVVTKFLSPEDIGLRSVIYEAALLFATLAQLGTTSSIIRFFPYFRNEEKQHNGFFFYILILPVIGCLLFIPLYLLLKAPIIAFFGKESQLFTSYFYWVVPLIIFLAFWSVFETYSNVNMRIVIPKMVREVIVRVLLVAVYLLYGFHVINRDGFISLFVVVYGIAMLIMLFYVSRIAPVSLKHDHSFIEKPLRKDIKNYTFVLLIGALGTTILGKLDLFMVSSELGFDFAGIYTIAFYMATIIDIPARSITAISSPIAATALQQGNTDEANWLYKKVSLNQLIIGGLLFVCIWINIDNIFQIIPNGEIYAQGKWVVFFIGLSRLTAMTLNFGGILISFSRYYYWSIIFTFVITALGILLNFLLIPVLGISGAAIASLIATILSYGFQQWIVLRKIKGNPYTRGTLKMILIILLLFAINCFLPYLGNKWTDLVFRTAIVGAIAFAAVYFGKVSNEINEIIRGAIEKIRHKPPKKDI